MQESFCTNAVSLTRCDVTARLRWPNEGARVSCGTRWHSSGTLSREGGWALGGREVFIVGCWVRGREGEKRMRKKDESEGDTGRRRKRRKYKERRKSKKRMSRKKRIKVKKK